MAQLVQCLSHKYEPPPWKSRALWHTCSPSAGRWREVDGSLGLPSQPLNTIWWLLRSVHGGPRVSTYALAPLNTQRCIREKSLRKKWCIHLLIMTESTWNWFFKRGLGVWRREWLTALVALLEVLDLIPIPRVVAHSLLWLQFWEIWHLLLPSTGTRRAHGAQIHYMQAKHPLHFVNGVLFIKKICFLVYV